MKVHLPAIFNKITSLADGSYKLEFITRELGSDAAFLMTMIHKEGWLLLSLNELQEADIPDEKADSSLSNKTQSQRTRGVIWRIWEAKGKPGSAEDYYQKTMSAINDQLKLELAKLTD
jgi:hypothetical protein